MNKEVNFLNFAKPQDSKNDTVVKSFSSETKKEKMSLFDSLLMNTKKETSLDDTKIKNEATKVTSDSSLLDKNAKTNLEEEIINKQTSASNTTVTLSDEKKEQVSNNKNTLTSVNSPNIQSEGKEEQTKSKTTNSLLDRMVLEIKNKLTSNSELKEGSKEQKQTSLFDSLISDKIKDKSLISNKIQVKDENLSKITDESLASNKMKETSKLTA